MESVNSMPMAHRLFLGQKCKCEFDEFNHPAGECGCGDGVKCLAAMFRMKTSVDKDFQNKYPVMAGSNGCDGRNFIQGVGLEYCTMARLMHEVAFYSMHFSCGCFIVAVCVVMLFCIYRTNTNARPVTN